jgi:two-component system cell cycle response regulator
MPHADRELQRAQSSGQPLAIAITDFDNFKTINDSHGHQAGDEVLRELARLFRSQARRADVLARYGGDEFVLLFPNTDRDEVRAWADRITAALAATSIRAQGVSIKPALSIGAAALDGQPASLDDLLKRADVALYEAKQQGPQLPSVGSFPSSSSVKNMSTTLGSNSTPACRRR